MFLTAAPDRMEQTYRHVLTRLVITAALTPGLHQLDSNTSVLLSVNQRHYRLQ